ncbi:hypothetical protein ACIQMP_08375 [Streptomyces sp. NPDC091385]|uniref:hypothetical protein n=1 Tax=Streptomyces sp. NPDC091385 TaxID=3365997 RepID=UPI0037FFC3D5
MPSRPLPARRTTLGIAAAASTLALAVTTPAHAQSNALAAQGSSSTAHTLHRVTHASLEWGVNAIYQGGNPANANCNFFSAGTQKEFRPVRGHVRVVHRMPDGTAQGVSDATKCVPGGPGTRLSQRVLFTDGTGRADRATGQATIRWRGAFTANAYGGLVTWYLKDPTLTVARDGSGTLTATGGGTGADRNDPEQQTKVPPRRVTVATFDRVRLARTTGRGGGAQISPRFSGVDYFPLVDGVRSATSAIPDAVKKAKPDWGSWPESFVDLQYETGLSSYWHTSGLSADPDKPPYDLSVRFDSAPEIRNVPVIRANPATTATAPYIEGRDLLIKADARHATALQWERAASANGPWSPVDGATGESLAIQALDSSWNGTYIRLAATNSAGRAVSAALRLTTAPYAVPVFSEQPHDLAAIQGTDAAVTFRVTGNPAVDPKSVALERSSDAGATWKPWTEARYGGGAGQFTIPAIPLTADGDLARVRAANTEGTTVTSAPFSVRVFPATGRPQLVVVPDEPVDPSTPTRLTVLGAGFDVPDWASPTLTYSLDLGLFDAAVWQPGQRGTRAWIATSPQTSGGQLYHDALRASGGAFTVPLTVPAGRLEPGRSYGIGGFLRLTDIETWRDTFENRSLDAWTPVSVSPK